MQRLKLRKINRKSAFLCEPRKPVYKCLMLGPNNRAKDVFFKALGEERSNVTEVLLRTEQSDLGFWRADVKKRPSTHCLRTYLGLLSPHMVFYFLSLEEEDDHRELSTLLAECSGKVALSGYPSDLYDELYSGWNRIEFDIANHASGGKRKDREKECLWMNYQYEGECHAPS